MQQIKSIGVIQTSLVFGALNFALGVLSAIVMAIAPMTPMMHGHPGMLVSMPIAYALGGFLLSAILCVAYNVVAKLVGGIAIELTSGPDIGNHANADDRASERA